MAIFKAPRITTGQRMGLTLQESEIVYDIEQKIFYGGNGVSIGGVPIGYGLGVSKETFVLTQTDLDNKHITLSYSPLFPGNVTLVPAGGIPQINGIDFEVVGDQVSWDGLGLDGNFLEVNDILIIQY